MAKNSWYILNSPDKNSWPCPCTTPVSLYCHDGTSVLHLACR